MKTLNKKTINKRGFIFLDVIVGLFIFGIIISIIFKFDSFSFSTIKSNGSNIELHETINNKISEIYNIKDWSSLKEDNGDIDIYYEYENDTGFGTERIEVIFSKGDIIKEYKLERSLKTKD